MKEFTDELSNELFNLSHNELMKIKKKYIKLLGEELFYHIIEKHKYDFESDFKLTVLGIC